MATLRHLPGLTGRLKGYTANQKPDLPCNYVHPPFKISLNIPPELEGFSDFEEARPSKGGRRMDIRGLARIDEPLIIVHDNIVQGVAKGKRVNCANAKVNWDIQSGRQVLGDLCDDAELYDPGILFVDCFKLRTATQYVAGVASLAKACSDIEAGSLTDILGTTPAPGVNPDPRRFWLGEPLEDMRKKMNAMAAQQQPGWDTYGTSWTDAWGRWCSRFVLAGETLTMFKGTAISIIRYKGRTFVGSAAACDHVYTILSAANNWLIMEEHTCDAVMAFMMFFRKQVLRRHLHEETRAVCQELEMFGQAVCDLFGDCGPRFPAAAITSMAKALKVPPDRVIAALDNDMLDDPIVGWISAMRNLAPHDIMSVAQLHKPAVFAFCNIEDTINKQVDRTTKKLDVDEAEDALMVAYTIMEMVRLYMGTSSNQSLPELKAFTPEAEEIARDMVITFSTEGAVRFWAKYGHERHWLDIAPCNIVEQDKNAPMVDLLRSKRVHADKVNFSGVSKEDEVAEFLINGTDDIAPDPAILLAELRAAYEAHGDNFVFRGNWEFLKFSPQTQAHLDGTGKFKAELNLKQREQKPAGRTYATGTMSVKKPLAVISNCMRQLHPFMVGTVMSMSEEGRRQATEVMGTSTAKEFKPGRLKGHIDIAGHNQSYQYKNTSKLFRALGHAMGLPDLQYVMMLFPLMTFHMHHPLLNAHVVYSGARGGIEGWLGDLWGAHTGCVAAYFLHKQGLDGVAATYGDDVVLDAKMPLNPSFERLETDCAAHFMRVAGQETKVSQMSWCRSRASLTRKSYVCGQIASADLKRGLSMSYLSDSQLTSDGGCADGISASASSAMADSNQVWPILVLKWAHMATLAVGLMYAIVRQGNGELLPPTVAKHAIKADAARVPWRTFEAQLDKHGVYVGAGVTVSRVADSEDFLVTTRSGKGTVGFEDLLDHISASTATKAVIASFADPKDIFALCALPQSLGGLGVSLWLNSCISGLSETQAEVLEVLNRHANGHVFRHAMGMVVETGISVSQLISSRYPSTGKCKGHNQIIVDALRSRLKKIIKNPAILEYMKLSAGLTELQNVIVEALAPAFVQRVAEKYYDVSEIAILDTIISKISNTGMILRLLGHPRHLGKELRELGVSNFKMMLGCKPHRPVGLIRAWLDGRRSLLYPRIRFVDPHEPGIVSLLDGHTSLASILVSKVPNVFADGAQRSAFMRQDVQPKYRKLGVFDFLVPSVILRKVIDCARFTVWFEYDQGCKTSNVTQLANYILWRLGQYHMDMFRDAIPPPSGGELAHRMDNHGFKQGVVARAGQRYSGSVSCAFSNEFLLETHGVDSNVNIGVLDAAVRIAYIWSADDPSEAGPTLAIGVNEMGVKLTSNVRGIKLHGPPFKDFPRTDSLLDRTEGYLAEGVLRYCNWISRCHGYESYRSITDLHKLKIPRTNSVKDVAILMVNLAASELDLPANRITADVVERLAMLVGLSVNAQAVMAQIKMVKVAPSGSRQNTHQDIRDGLAKRFSARLLPLVQMPKFVSDNAKNLLVSLVLQHGLVFVRSPLGAALGSVRIDWALTLTRSCSIAAIAGTSKDFTGVHPSTAWYSPVAIGHVIKVMEQSKVLCDDMGVLRDAAPGYSVSVLQRVNSEHEAPPIGALTASLSRVYEDESLSDLCKRLMMLKLIHESYGSYLPDKEAHHAVLKELQRHMAGSLSVFDATAGRGDVGFAAGRLGIVCHSHTTDDVWLRGGVREFVEVEERYDYLVTATWPVFATTASVHYIDAHVLYKHAAVRGSLVFPATTKVIVVRCNSQVVPAVELACPDLHLLFPHRYMMVVQPAWRHAYLVLSREKLSEHAANWGPAVTSAIRYIGRNVDIQDVLTEGRVTWEQKVDVCRGFLIDTKDTGTYDPLDAKELLSWLNQLEAEGHEGETAADVTKRFKTDPKSVSHKAARLIRQLQECDLDPTGKLIFDGLNSTTMLDSVLRWLSQAYRNGIGDTPAAYFVMRFFKNQQAVRSALTMVKEIRLWQGPFRQAVDELKISVAPVPLVIKTLTKGPLKGRQFLAKESVRPGPTVAATQQGAQRNRGLALALMAAMKGTIGGVVAKMADKNADARIQEGAVEAPALNVEDIGDLDFPLTAFGDEIADVFATFTWEDDPDAVEDMWDD